MAHHPLDRPAPGTVALMRVSLFVTCVVDLLDPDVGVAAVRLLRATGCDVSCPSGQTCCGQPAWNSGFAREAAAVARTTLDALDADAADAVVVPAGSCATMVRVFWPELFELVDDHDAAVRARRLAARTYELTELLAERADSLPPLRLPEPTTVAYHHSCHMLRELRIEEQPVALLDRLEGCTRIGWEADHRCCGFGGLFSMKLPEASEAMADHKLDDVEGAGAALVVGADESCLLHLRGRAEHEQRPVTTRHIAQLLADGLP
jgi:L-lactate dehydrogenase complex protein LldE